MNAYLQNFARSDHPRQSCWRFWCGVFQWLTAVLSLALVAPASAQDGVQGLTIIRPEPGAFIRLNTSIQSNTLLLLEASPNLREWSPFATLHDAARAYPDVASPTLVQRFYRASSRARTATDDWKNQIVSANEAFRSPDASHVRWVKFAILANDPTRVYYQDSTKFPFHYDYASLRLPPFIGVSRVTFDQVSLHPASQQVILGSVLFPPGNVTAEYGIQLVGLEPYAPQTAANILQLVSASIHTPSGAQPFYIPTWEQFDSAVANDTFFQDRGFPVSSTQRWAGASTIYAPGWAFGRFVYVPAAEITAAYTDGRLLPTDILLTDGVPAEVPLVAGIISLLPSTPNSHVAILSRSFGIPFLYIADAGERQRVQQLAGHEIVIRVRTVSNNGTDEIKVIDVDDGLSADVRNGLLTLKAPPLLNFLPKKSYGNISAPADSLVPADAQYFGGKAANFGLLRRTIPNNSPPAIAFSFDLWDQFLDQTLPIGKTLRVEIAERLAAHPKYPPNMPALRTTLTGIRDLITTTARFSPAQQAAIINALSSFDPASKIRFRSSTNMEDAEQFTGAGLYDSFSGCLLDDLDGDTNGPCGCDPAESGERGVFRAIQKVYASFYNDNAFLERLRHQVNEAQVGMALLVHHSYPDEEANGVATVNANLRTSFSSYTADLVTQIGEISVTNPEGDALPELVRASQIQATLSLSVTSHSSLLPLGSHVLNWEGDYRDLMGLLTTVTSNYRLFHPTRNQFLLDFEYKKEGGAMVVKQVRPLPLPSGTGSIVPFLINEPVQYRVFQGEYSDVFANHRLKSSWTLRTRNLQLTDTNLQQSFYADSQIDLVKPGGVDRLTGPLSTWPGTAYSVDGNIAADRWVLGAGAGQRTYNLETTVIRSVTDAQHPVVTNADFSKLLRVTYATPVQKLLLGKVTSVTEELVRLVPPLIRTTDSLLQTRSFSNASGMEVRTLFYWPKPSGGLVAGYTAPLVDWEETRITGLTSEPIILRGYYSQTYRPEHHNFAENFFFEPRLEEGMSPAILSELAAADIQGLYCMYRANGNNEFWALGFDGQLRRLP